MIIKNCISLNQFCSSYLRFEKIMCGTNLNKNEFIREAFTIKEHIVGKHSWGDQEQVGTVYHLFFFSNQARQALGSRIKISESIYWPDKIEDQNCLDLQSNTFSVF